jgi:hypothetical protein
MHFCLDRGPIAEVLKVGDSTARLNSMLASYSLIYCSGSPMLLSICVSIRQELTASVLYVPISRYLFPAKKQIPTTFVVKTTLP